jgi:phenylacetate-CoA ligase
VKPWHQHGYLWGYDLAPDKARRTKLLDSLQNRFRMFTFDKGAVQDFAFKLRNSTYLRGYSSMIFEVAKIINELGLEQPPLKMVLGTSEMILDAYQPHARAAFGKGIISEYGAAESGLIAFECPRGKMHINMEDLVVDTDEDGGIIITNLASFSFPIIRYILGDTVAISDEYCECGREHPVMTEILGRKGVSVQSSVRRYPAFTFYYVFKNLAVHNSMPLNYKAVQEEVGIVDIYIEGSRSDECERLIHSELSKYFDSDMTFRIHFIPFFERSRRKQQSFENRLG